MTQQHPVENENSPEIPFPAKASPEAASAVSAAEASQLAQAVIETIRKPLLVLGSGMRGETANRSFYHVFEMSPAAVEQNCLYDLADGQWDVPELRDLLEHVWTQETPAGDLELEYQFPRSGSKILLLYARRLTHQDNPRLILPGFCLYRLP
jgi:nitrogen-specific signal transduction histidine kinase